MVLGIQGRCGKGGKVSVGLSRRAMCPVNKCDGVGAGGGVRALISHWNLPSYAGSTLWELPRLAIAGQLDERHGAAVRLIMSIQKRVMFVL